MRTNLYISFASAATLAILIAGCSAATNDDKKGRLEKLKAEQAKVNTEIAKLEAELAKENPDANVKYKQAGVT